MAPMGGSGGDGPTWKDWRFKSVRAHRRKVYCLGWNSEGKRLASGSVDMTVRINRVDDHCGVKSEAELRGHEKEVTYLGWHPTHPDKLVSISQQEKTVRFWDTRQSKNTATVSTPGLNLYVTWSPDAHFVAVVDRSDVLSIIDARKMKVAHKYPFKQQINVPLFSADGRQLFLCTGTGEVEIHSFPDMRRTAALKGHSSAVVGLASDRQQRWLASGGMDAVACLWDMQDWICQRTFIGMDYPVRSMSFSHDSRYLAIAAEQTVLDVEDLQTGQSLGLLPLRHTPEDVAFNPKHLMLASAGGYGTDASGMTYGDIELRWKPT